MKKSVSAQVNDAILADIFSGSLRPGQILSERMLMEAYGCSKTTLREILASLCRAHVLRSIPRMGYEVLRVEQEEARDTMEYRRVLEVGYLRQNFSRITPEVIARLKACNDPCRSPEQAGDLWSHWDFNAAFHLELIQVTGSSFSVWNLQFVLDTQKRACIQNLMDQYDGTLAAAAMAHHDSIICALEQGDVEAACRALEEDLSVFTK